MLAICASLIPVFGAPAALAADFPVKPVRMVVGFAPGGGTDVIARLIATELGEKWGEAAIVDNRPGAEGTIASDYVARSAPDGHTLLFVNGSFAVPPSFKVAFDSVKSFAPVAMLATQPAALVVSLSFNVQNLKELIAMAKAKPGQLTYGSTGARTEPALKMAQFLQRIDTTMLNVPYRGTGPIITAVMGNEVNMTITPINTALPLINSGRLKALAVSSSTRSPILPDTPTIAEAGDLKGFEAATWYGVLAPAGTPKDVLQKIHDDIEAVVRTPKVAETLRAQGFLPAHPYSPGEFADYLERDVKRVTALVESLGLK